MSQNPGAMAGMPDLLFKFLSVVSKEAWQSLIRTTPSPFSMQDSCSQ